MALLLGIIAVVFLYGQCDWNEKFQKRLDELEDELKNKKDKEVSYEHDDL